MNKDDIMSLRDASQAINGINNYFLMLYETMENEVVRSTLDNCDDLFPFHDFTKLVRKVQDWSYEALKEIDVVIITEELEAKLDEYDINSNVRNRIIDNLRKQ